jgi:hypothetical protein
MDRLSPGARASHRLIAEKEALASEITEAMYAADPGLLERYGETGRVRCHEDMRYNLEHLAPAVELEDPGMFSRYVGWLDDLLRARDVSSDDVVKSLHLTERVVRAHFAADEMAAVEPCIRAGLDALRAEDAS